MSFDGIRNTLMGYDFASGGDAKHTCLYNEFGYPEFVTYSLARRAYDRIGIAQGAINYLHAKSFETMPNVYEGGEEDEDKKKTSNEKQFELFAKKSGLWRAYKSAAIRRSVGVYSALIIKVADGKGWDQPVDKINPNQIKGFIPCWQEQIKPTEWDQDTFSPNYGEPLQYVYQEFDMNAVKTDVASPTRNLTIHRDRVIYFGDIMGNGSEPEEGTMLLRPCYNALVDWQKNRGSAAEGNYKNAARHIALEFDGQVQPHQLAQMLGVDVSKLGDAFDEMGKDLNSNFDAVLALMGAKVNVLSSTMPDPEKPAEIALNEVAAALNLSAKGIIGSQTGERASTEDSAMDNKTAQAYRESVLDYEIHKLMDRFAEFGMWDNIEWSVSWDSLLEASELQKLENGKIMAEIIATVAPITGETPFNMEEMRKVCGYEVDADVGDIEKRLRELPKPEDIEERIDV